MADTKLTGFACSTDIYVTSDGHLLTTFLCSILAPYGNHGCQKGSMEVAYIYTIDTGGIDTEDAYPYEGMQGKCRFKKKQGGDVNTQRDEGGEGE